MLVYLNISLDKIPEHHVIKHKSGDYLSFMCYPTHYVGEFGYTHNIALLQSEQEMIDDLPKIMIGRGRKHHEPVGDNNYWLQFYCNINLTLVPEEAVDVSQWGHRFLACNIVHYANQYKDKNGYNHGIYLPTQTDEQGNKLPKVKIGRAKAQYPRYRKKPQIDADKTE